ncbi:MAG TPA: acetyl-CoA C-acetyltransferase [bacterium]|nr:acetyl-CoA C-acetyltransferase [bacterium]
MAVQDVVLAAPVRTPIGKFGGVFSELSAADLGTFVVKACLERAELPADVVSELILGNARQAGTGPNIARQVLYRAGIPITSPAYTINQACASGIKSIINAYQDVVLGEAELVVAGGTESMSNAPYLLTRARWGYRLGHGELVDAMYRDGFLCPLSKLIMGETAEKLAEQYGISREEQDRYAVESQVRCERARKQGRFKDEIVPIPLEGAKGSTRLVDQDEHPRDGVTLESISKLPPVFRPGGSVHAGNSSGITDGAAAILVLSAEKARSLGVRPWARVVGSAICGVDPSIMGIGPVPAVRTLLHKTGIRLDQIGLIELNEAFAAQVLACQRDLNLDLGRTNVNGGSIALGHPIGCTGARIVVTLLHEMEKRRESLGLATLCVSGGLGAALLLERCA